MRKKGNFPGVILSMTILFSSACMVRESQAQTMTESARSRGAIPVSWQSARIARKTSYSSQHIRKTVAVIRLRYGRFIEEAAVLYRVPPSIIVAGIYVESQGNQSALSQKGCKGLMQICDSTARQYGVRNVYDPRENILGGTYILAEYLRKYAGNNYEVALTTYAIGPAATHRLIRKGTFDPDHSKYVSRVEEVLKVMG